MKALTQIKTFRNYANYDPKNCAKILKVLIGIFVALAKGILKMWANNGKDLKQISMQSRIVTRHLSRKKSLESANAHGWTVKSNMTFANVIIFFLKKARKSNREEERNGKITGLRNRVTRKIRKAKEAYNRKLFEENIMPNKQQTTSTSIKVNGQHCTDKHTIANAINNYFTSIVSRLLSSVGLNKAARNKESLQESRHPTFKFQLVTE